MGDQEAEPTLPQTELEEITSKISDLNKWREIFSFCGLETNNSTYQGLRKLLFGNTSHLFSCEWAQAYFRFREPYSDLAYALEAEKIQLFEFFEKAAAQEFIFDHINCSNVEKQVSKRQMLPHWLVQEDLDSTATPLLNTSFGNITCTQAMLSLLLTGRASPRELDGDQEPGHGGEVWRQRGPVGYLCWDRAQAEQQVCHGLRTPQLPVWLCSLSGRYGVLFGTNSQLLSDWKMERVFHLYFYNGQWEQRKTAHLTIDTHSHPWEKDPREDPSSPGKRCPPLEMAIRTKWAGATVSWNGTEPFF
ncbi:hypothetical protein llap_10338 [Limosa lapponica baueri]|uniref:Ubiquitin carboxyl-terminal hydrolase MINDY n=1 Tax=Limosa lapponica baueri TaxID=1758121 RepID=A0A2I0TZZ2_LIMLA|nr:hypothetical protein llap_10338 [Limosa lapponica baueri]